jgi:hypothetical protein
MSEKGTNSIKRGRQEAVGGEEEDRGIKRCKLGYNDADCHPTDDPNDESNSTSEHHFDPDQPARFLDFHFTVLRSLYLKSKEAASSSLPPSASTGGDASTGVTDDNEVDGIPIDEAMWSNMEVFLKERVQILRTKQQASSWSGIHQGALQVAKTEVHPNHASPLMARRRHAPSPIHFYGSHHSLHPTAVPTSQMSMATPTKPTSSDNSFQIIARLLGKRSEAMSMQYERHKDVYKPLLASTEQRIRYLQERLTTLQQTMEEENQKRMSDLLNGTVYRSTKSGEQSSTAEKHKDSEGTKNRLVALKTKIRLWALFAADLKDVV